MTADKVLDAATSDGPEDRIARTVGQVEDRDSQGPESANTHRLTREGFKILIKFIMENYTVLIT